MIPIRVKNLTGQSFGRLTVIEFVEQDKHRNCMWRCKCICGNFTTVTGGNLTSGHTTSCGCHRKEKLSSSSSLRTSELQSNMIGKTFGRLIVQSFISIKDNKSLFSCLCSCGNVVEVLGNSLNSGNTQSCGCYSREISSIKSITHGLSDHPLYSTWSNILQRCYNPNNDNYHNYGGRGIYVCDEWKNDPQAFISWAEANGYQFGLTIDRYPDQNGNYEPDNCRWTTMTEQARNRRSTILSPEKIRAIRSDSRKYQEIALAYNISEHTVQGIMSRSTWKDMD